MMVFLLGAVVLLAVGIGFLLWPLLRRRAGGGARDRALVTLYRDQLRELDADRASAAINEEQYESGRRALERRLLDEVTEPGAAAAVSGNRRWLAAGIAAFVLVVPVVLYMALGTPEAVTPGASGGATASAQDGAADGGGQAAQGKAHPITQQQVEEMVDKLAKRLEQNPADGEGWAMLGRSYAYLHKFPEAVSAFRKAADLRPNDAALFADYADALAMTLNKSLTGEPMKLVEHALAVDPKDVKALALAGSEAFDRKDYTAAVGFWERAVQAGPPDQQFAQQLKAGLEEARQLAGGKAPLPMAAAAGGPDAGGPMAGAADTAASGSAVVKGRVQLSAALAGKAAPNDTVFVFARAANGPRMPLALLRKQVKDLPLEFALDDSMAMMPSLKLSNYQSVVIGARVSKAGDAKASSGDLQGFSEPVKVGSSGVDVKIDQVVP